MNAIPEMIHVVLCGGAGTRLWPLSSQSVPKQFLKLFEKEPSLAVMNASSSSKGAFSNSINKKHSKRSDASNEEANSLDKLSLFQKIVLGNQPFTKGCICICNSEHHFLLKEQLAEIHITPLMILLEGCSRNTAAAIGLAACAADIDTLLLITPADQYVEYDEKYAQAIEKAKLESSKNRIALFGIHPCTPETGYGYIEALNGQVKRFHEKPTEQKAAEYIKSGTYYWNSGMLCASSRTLINEMEKHAPVILSKIQSAVNHALSSSTHKSSLEIPYEDMATIPEKSFDYAVLEKSANLRLIPSAFEWSDLGSFDSLHTHLAKDVNGNVSVQNNAVFYDSQQNFVIGNKRMVVTVDLDDCVIVDTDDVLLIAKRGQTQDVKDVVKYLKNTNRFPEPSKNHEIRPWGHFYVLLNEDAYKIKKLVVFPGKRLSLQKHQHRCEHWVVVSGTALVTLGHQQTTLKVNDSVHIPLGTIHRIENQGDVDLVIIEVQYGEQVIEEDIIRYEDDFNRI